MLEGLKNRLGRVREPRNQRTTDRQGETMKMEEEQNVGDTTDEAKRVAFLDRVERTLTRL